MNSQQSRRRALTNDEQEPRPSAEKIERDGPARFGEQPCQFGHGPDRLAVDGDDQLLRQAALLDPLTGAVLNPPEVWDLIDDMLVEQAEWLPQYASVIDELREKAEA